MAKDPSKKGVRKIPPEFLKWIEVHYGPDAVKWYKKVTGTGKAEATKQRQRMSDIVGSTGAFHEGHFQGAKDFDPEMGGGPTTGRTMRPEIGVTNVAHAEMPRMSKADMRRLGIPQFWVEDFYEAILESEGQKVIGNLDVQGALDVDRGMDPEQAAAQTRVRDDLRAQGEEIPGSRYTGTDKPAPITQVPTETPRPPQFDASSIKTGTGIPRVSGESRVAIPRNPIEFNNGVARLRKGATLAAGAGLLALGPWGTAASAAETAERTKIAQQTGSLLDKTQAGISGISLSADIASYNPFTAIPGAVVSTGADALNLIIDGGRAMLSGTATYDRKQRERQERLRRLPADHAERQGFAAGGGM